MIGRKNWLFANTPNGADSSCILYSLIESAKLNGLVPFYYIQYLLEKMPAMKLSNENIEQLLPWAKELPDHVRMPHEEAIDTISKN